MLVNNPEQLALYIQDQRKTQGLSQSQVGDKVGLRQSTISAFETNTEATKIDTLFRILAATGLQIHVHKKR